MRALAITGMETAEMMPSIMSGSLMRAMPPCTRMSAGTRSSAMTATAPASSAILACSGVTTSMMTPPLSISAMPRFTRAVPTSAGAAVLTVERALAADTADQPFSVDGASIVTPPVTSSGRAGCGFANSGLAAPLRDVADRSRLDGELGDVEVAGQRVPDAEPECSRQPAAAQRQGVPDSVVVHLAGDPEPPADHRQLGHHRIVR